MDLLECSPQHEIHLVSLDTIGLVSPSVAMVLHRSVVRLQCWCKEENGGNAPSNHRHVLNLLRGHVSTNHLVFAIREPLLEDLNSS
jgi:hypothetical protein